MLQSMDQVFPPFLSFHLRQLFLRFNLTIDKRRDHHAIYSNINDFYIQEFADYLLHSYESLLSQLREEDTVRIFKSDFFMVVASYLN